MRTLAATEFKARCLALLDEVAQTGEPVTITKRGKPVARLVAPTPEGGRSPQDELKGTVRVLGDITSPVAPSRAWNALRPPRPRRGSR